MGQAPRVRSVGPRASPRRCTRPELSPLEGTGAPVRLSPRRAFVVVAGSVLATAMVLLVVRPAVERGGAGEVVLILAFVGAVLVVERWLRTR